MNKFSLAFLLVTIALYANAEPSESKQSGSEIVRCYQCNQISEGGCKDPFGKEDKYLKECENGEAYCRKIVQTVNDETTVIRQCAKELYKPGYEGCYKTAGKASQMVCTCKGSNDKGCNNGLAIKSSLFAVVLSVFLSVLLFK